MTIYTSIRRHDSFLEEHEAPFTDSIRAAVSDPLLRPTQMLERFSELDTARRGRPSALQRLGNFAAFGLAGALLTPLGEREEPDSPLIPAERARARVDEENLDLKIPDEGLPERALDILIARKRDERRRQDVLNRAPKGVGATSARLAASLAASALDPLNVASAFVPVVREARYAALTARFGRTGGRAVAGALEGAVGAALVEPIVAVGARAEQADYGLHETLLNIGLGTVLGGGLHVGAGALGDAVARGADWRRTRAEGNIPRVLAGKDPATREAALRTTVAQGVTGREIDAEPIVTYEPAPQGQTLRAGVEIDSAISPASDFATLARGGPGIHPARFMRRYPVLSWLRDLGGVEPSSPLAGELRQLGVQKNTVRGLFKPGGRTAVDNFPWAEEGDFFNVSAEIADNGYVPESAVLDAIREELHGNPVRTPEQRARIDEWQARSDELEVDLQIDRAVAEMGLIADNALLRRAKRLVETGDEIDAEAALERAIIQLADEDLTDAEKTIIASEIPFDFAEGRSGARGSEARTAFADFAAGQETGGRTPSAEIAGPRGAPRDLRAQAEASFNLDNARLYDAEGVRAAEAEIAAGPAEDAIPDVTLEEALTEVDAMAAQLGESETVARELQPFDELEATAETYGNAVRAAARCRLNRGA